MAEPASSYLSYVSYGNMSYIDSLYEKYEENPGSVDYGWQKFFEGFNLGIFSAEEKEKDPASSEIPTELIKEINVLNMIHDYRTRGHLFTKTNPVCDRRAYTPGKNLEQFGLSDADLDVMFKAGAEVGLGPAKLRNIRDLLEQTYCNSIAIEYKYILDPKKITWFESKMEKAQNNPVYSVEAQKQIFGQLNKAVSFESFLHTKFVGQKRFSIEGAEALVPAMNSMIVTGVKLGAEEFIIGMGHRGRLNILANVIGKSYKEIFSEFQGKNYNPDEGFGGDVKYHLGFSNEMEIDNSGKKVHLSLCPNPSHLETVNGVVEGITRSKIDSRYKGDNSKIVPVLLHGDASLAGQGVVYETLQMSKLEGYQTGGTIHIVINNQVGFTTDYKDARSSLYCTDLAKVVHAPVFHVNGDDAEALIHVLNVAIEYRQLFKEDIFIDVVCYRKYGHNEGDEPKFTQPLLYSAIDNHPNPKEVYRRKIQEKGEIDLAFVEEVEKAFTDLLEKELDESKNEKLLETKAMFSDAWEGYHRPTDEEFSSSPDTSISKDELVEIGNKISTLPADKKFLKKIDKLFEGRRKSLNEEMKFDWAMGELLAYGSLLKQNIPIRFSGEDVKRGTFSHRHAVVTDIETGEGYTPLNNLDTEAKFSIYNSLLSEYGVLGFEYGYASANPHGLVIWEAQFGDFINVAQVIVDQYIASAETKWKLGNGLVLLLPHGYEGQGPEHSSARIERFLELCADNNFQVANCSTPANFFHILRRQQLRKFRKPLVIFTPKSLLRHPQCFSLMEDFTNSQFQAMIDDSFVNPKNVKKVIFCSGKIYYDLLERQRAESRKDVAIVRIELLYPAPMKEMEKLKDKYSNATEFVWVQEEPENMGAWPYMCRKFRKSKLQLDIISRNESSSTATGYSMQHTAEQKVIIESAFAL